MADSDHDRFGQGFNMNSRILITAIVCLFFVVVIMAGLHMYARYVLRRQERRRELMRQSIMASAAAQMSANGQQRTGLDAGVIATLPIFIYNQGANVHYECSVCLSNLEEGEMARLLPNCKHTFHSQCIDTWLRAHSTCPICRTEAKPILVRPESIEVGVVVPPTAPPVVSSEGTSESVGQYSKTVESSSRLSSFRRMLSSRRLQPNDQTDTSVRDLERQ
ncbi:RING-type E3 ubiquitin transferase [Ranunculus cassubicifolius]